MQFSREALQERSVARGSTIGFQAQEGNPLEDTRGFHGSWRAGIEELVPSSRTGWAQHVASHPDKVYGAASETDAWIQAESSGSRRLGELSVGAEDGRRLHDLVDDSTDPTIKPTVYDTTVRGDVTTDPEFDQIGDGTRAFRGDRGEVHGELSMPVGAQGSLLPDFFGRSGRTDMDGRGRVYMDTSTEDDPHASEMMSGKRYSMPKAPPPEVTYPGAELDRLNKIPGEQMTRQSWDRGVEAVSKRSDLFEEAAFDLKDAARHERRSPRLFPLSEVQQMGSNFPYGKPAGWDDQRRAAGWRDV